MTTGIRELNVAPVGRGRVQLKHRSFTLQGSRLNLVSLCTCL